MLLKRLIQNESVFLFSQATQLRDVACYPMDRFSVRLTIAKGGSPAIGAIEYHVARRCFCVELIGGIVAGVAGLQQLLELNVRDSPVAPVGLATFCID